EACCIVTSCNGVECTELHICRECRDRAEPTPSAQDQRSLVAPAMEDAQAGGLTEDDIARSLEIDPGEIRRIMAGQGVADPAAWERIRAHLVIPE
ncbi:MAG TPA: hypothetical protein PLU54_13390, partial [Deltaproteobacteria bacterium]|nr:hypothetical protein [Deltaproteobacteria bacterium]